jgi:hypothetical protein
MTDTVVTQNFAIKAAIGYGGNITPVGFTNGQDIGLLSPRLALDDSLRGHDRRRHDGHAADLDSGPGHVGHP